MKETGIGRVHIPDWVVVSASASYGQQPTMLGVTGIDGITALLVEWTGQPRNVVLAAIKRARERGYLEWEPAATPSPAGLSLVQSSTRLAGEQAADWWAAELSRLPPGHDG